MRRIAIVVIAGIVLPVITIGVAGEILSWPALHTVGAPPPDIHASSVEIPTSSTEYVAGWFARGKPGGGAVLLLHGVRSDRWQMVERARFLEAAGYSVLLIDLPAHGESPAERITFGVHESAGVRAALAFLHRELPEERVGVIGVSLGAASLVFAHPDPAPDAVVLESMYPTIEDAVADRLAIRLGAAGRALSPVLLWQVPMRLGISTGQLRPIAEMSHLNAPVLIASGTQDQHTRWSETTQLFAATAEPKELWPVEGAAHVDLCHYAHARYEEKILAFFAKYLRMSDCNPIVRCLPP